MSEQEHVKGTPGVWKKPNFGLIVAMSAIFILLMLVGAYLFARKGSKDVVPSTRQGSIGSHVLSGGTGGRVGASSQLGEHV